MLLTLLSKHSKREEVVRKLGKTVYCVHSYKEHTSIFWRKATQEVSWKSRQTSKKTRRILNLQVSPKKEINKTKKKKKNIKPICVPKEEEKEDEHDAEEED